MMRFSPLTEHLAAHAVDTGLGCILALITEVQQSGHVVRNAQNDTAAMTAVAAVRAAGSHIFFTPEGNGTIAAPSADDCNSNFIDKHIKILLCRNAIDN